MPRHATKTSFQAGSKNPHWKGGIENIEILAPSTQEVYCRKEARRLMNFPDGVVHHKDGNVLNRDKSNLIILFGQSEHVAIHNRLRRGQHYNSLQTIYKDIVLSSNLSPGKLATKLGISKNTILRIRRRYVTQV